MKKRLKNFEKFKTEKERCGAFYKYCEKRETEKLCDCSCMICQFRWLDLEAEEEKPLPCPFCGGKCEWDDKSYVYKCTGCKYQSSGALREESAIAAHNRVAKAVMDAKREVK